MSASSSSSSLSNGLELATRGIDLLTTLIHASDTRSTGTLGLMVEVAKWLGRERLNQNELEDCFKRARSIAQPNERTVSFFRDLHEERTNRSLLTLHTRTTGSLGRMLALDPSLCWIVSTVACLFQYVSEYEVSNCLKTILRNGETIPKDRKTGKMSFQGFLSQGGSVAHLSRVVKAIVSSIWFNVVNAGHVTVPLPEELIDVCKHGHVLQSSNMAFLVTILRKPRQRLIIRSRHMYHDLTHWILLHYHGHFQVTVSGKIVYKRTLGSSDKDIELRVDQFCDDTGKCQDSPGRYQVIEDVAGNFEQLFEKEAIPQAERMEGPRIRRALYELPIIYKDNHHKSSLPSIKKQVKCAAQKVMTWLLQLIVYPSSSFTNLGFTISTSDTANEECIGTISTILARNPGLLNMQWGSLGSTRHVFMECRAMKEPLENIPDPILAPDRRFEELLPWFPILDDLVADVKQHCLCQRCKGSELLPGCLAYTAITECLALLAHGVADSFGVDDVSGSADNSTIAKGMLQILLDIVEERGMLWSVWFSVAACVLLGCPNPTVPIRADPTLSGGAMFTTTVVAMQYGSLVALAPWVDLNYEHLLPGCFGIITLRGKLGVNQSSSGGHRTFSGISDEFAVIGTEMTESTSSFVELRQKKPRGSQSSNDNSLDLSLDLAECTTDCMLVRVDDYYFSLMTRVMTDDHSRVVDPADALIRLARGINSLSCITGCPKVRDTQRFPNVGHITQGFSDILGTWLRWMHTHRFSSPETPLPSEDGSIDGETESITGEKPIHLSNIMDRPLKKNVMLALSGNGTVFVNDGSCCRSCLATKIVGDITAPIYVLNTQERAGNRALHFSVKKRLLLL